MTFLRLVVRIAAALAVVACVSPSHLPPAESYVVANTKPRIVSASSSSAVKVISLNVAHSRRMGVHQFFQGKNTAIKHLDGIVAMLHREKPDIVALQEADAASYWSGGFDHVNYLANEANFVQVVRGTHLKSVGIEHGTALLTQYLTDDTKSHGFSGRFSFNRKGFVVSSFVWPGTLNSEIDVVSVHLEPFWPHIRSRQAEELAAFIQGRGRPVIVMGDFNSDWNHDGSAIRQLSSALGLRPHDDICDACVTHRRLRRFVDWILISPELVFDTFEVLDDNVSDHYPVAATLRLRRPLVRVTNKTGNVVPKTVFLPQNLR